MPVSLGWDDGAKHHAGWCAAGPRPAVPGSHASQRAIQTPAALGEPAGSLVSAASGPALGHLLPLLTHSEWMVFCTRAINGHPGSYLVLHQLLLPVDSSVGLHVNPYLISACELCAVLMIIRESLEAHRATQHWPAPLLRGMVGQVGVIKPGGGARACSGFKWLLWAQNSAFHYSFREPRLPWREVLVACQSSTGGGCGSLPVGPDFFSLDPSC